VRSKAQTIDSPGVFGIVTAMGASAMRALGSSPRDAIGIFIAVVAAGAILINALHLQPGPHPAPIFAVKPRPVATEPAVANPVPRPRPTEAPATLGRARGDVITDIQRELSRRSLYDGPADGVLGPKTDAAIRDFEQSAGVKPTGEPTEALLRQLMAAPVKSVPVPVARPTRADPIADLIAPSSSQRVLAVQRALSDFGYGPLKLTGTFGPETKAAIEKFERDRKLPVSGQISQRLLRELAALTGRPLE
jgi:peptidoglycan hydrolase-like protein with peptidoglycan-binding domain